MPLCFLLLSNQNLNDSFENQKKKERKKGKRKIVMFIIGSLILLLSLIYTNAYMTDKKTKNDISLFFFPPTSSY